MTDTLRDDLLGVVDEVRGLPGDLGLRLYTVSIVKRVWSGTRVGFGSNTDTSKTFTVELGTYNVKIDQVKSHDVIASGGLYSSEDIVIGPLTPKFTANNENNSDTSDFEPATTSSPTEIFFKITGPGYPTAGAWFKKVSTSVTKSFRYTFVVRKTGEVP